MYQDTVIDDKLLHKPRFLGGVFIVIFLLFMLVNLSGTMIGHLFEPAIGNPLESGIYGRFVISFTLAFFITLNLLGISFLSYRYQVLVVWLELMMMFLLFFYSFDLSFPFIKTKIPFLITQGLVTTLYISAISITLAFIVAMMGAIAKLSDNGIANGIATFYTSFFRGLPLLMQVYLIYLGMPQLGFVIDAVPAGILALTLCYGAYMTEIFRAGIENIPKTQWEGARSLGFKFGLTMRKVILPQSIPLIIPPTGNQFIAMLKDSSLVSVIGVWELMYLARTLGTRDFKHMEMLITVAIIYWILTIILEFIQSRIERHYRSITSH